MIETYTIPCCSELWTEQMTVDFGRGIAIPEDDMGYRTEHHTTECDFDAEKSFRRLKAAYEKAYKDSPLLAKSRYLDTLNGKVY